MDEPLFIKAFTRVLATDEIAENWFADACGPALKKSTKAVTAPVASVARGFRAPGKRFTALRNCMCEGEKKK